MATDVRQRHVQQREGRQDDQAFLLVAHPAEVKQVEGEARFADRRPEAVAAAALRPDGDHYVGGLARRQPPRDRRLGRLLNRFRQGAEPHAQMVGRQPSDVPDRVGQVRDLARDDAIGQRTGDEDPRPKDKTHHQGHEHDGDQDRQHVESGDNQSGERQEADAPQDHLAGIRQRETQSALGSGHDKPQEDRNNGMLE